MLRPAHQFVGTTLGQNLRRHRLVIGLPVILAASTLGTYSGACGNRFVNFDDGMYITKNPKVKAGLTFSGICWAFTSTTDAANWHPLTYLSLQLDASLYGDNPWGFHLTNVLLHVSASALLFWILQVMTGAAGPSFITAALFALHPLHVESVAWAAERKDVLSALFFVLTLSAYVWYAQQPGLERYFGLVVVYACGLMAKAMLVTVPAVLLLLDYWPLRRWGFRWSARSREMPAIPATGITVRRLLYEKLPLLVLAIGSSVLTVHGQTGKDAVQSLERLPIGERSANAILAYVEYLGKTIWPADLAVYYPHPHGTIPVWKLAAAFLFLAFASAWTLVEARRHPYLPVGWFWYLGMMVPVIGIVQVGDQALADRYTYLPLIGIFVMAAWGLDEIAQVWHIPTAASAGLVGAALLWLALRSSDQVGYWRDSAVLWRHAKEMAPTSFLVSNNLGQALEDEGREDFDRLMQMGRPAEARQLLQRKLSQAVDQYEAALAVKSDAWLIHYNCGQALGRLSRYAEAQKELAEALRLEPEFPHGHYNLGLAYMSQGKLEEAQKCFREAIRQKPDFTSARAQLAHLLIKQGQFAKAIEQLKAVVRLEPENAGAYSALGLAFSLAGKWSDAAACYERAIALQPVAAPHYYDLAFAQQQSGHTAQAQNTYLKALSMDPRWAETANRGAWLLATHPQPTGRDGIMALRMAKEVCSIPGRLSPQYLDTLAAAYAEVGDFDQAVATARQALQLSSSADLSRAVEQRIRLYEAHKPYHADPSAPG